MYDLRQKPKEVAQEEMHFPGKERQKPRPKKKKAENWTEPQLLFIPQTSQLQKIPN